MSLLVNRVTKLALTIFSLFSYFSGFGQTISGITNVCSDINYDYYVPYSEGATYTWEVPSTATIINSFEERITLRWASNAGGSTLSCRVRSVSFDEWFHSPSISVRTAVVGKVSDKTICHGSNLVLNLVGASHVTFINWQRYSGSQWIDITNDDLQNITSSYNYRAKLQNQCTSAIVYSDQGLVSVNAPSGGVITNPAPQTICYPPGGTVNLHWDRGSNTNISGNPLRWEWQEGTGNETGTWNSTSFRNESDASFYITDKTITVRTVSFDSFCNRDVFAYLTIQSTPSAKTGVLNISSNRVCENISALGTFSVNNSNGSIVWYRYDEAHNSYVSIGSGISISAPNLTSTTSFRVTASVSPCAQAEQNFTITVDPLTVAGTLFSLASEYCGVSNVQISLDGSVGEVQYWQTRTKIGIGSWSVWSNINSQLANISQSIAPQGNQVVYYEYQAIVKSGACQTLLTPIKGLTVKPIPIAEAPNQTICSGQSIDISITNPNGVSGVSYSWTVSAPNILGALQGSGATIVQTLSQASSTNQIATYTITPTSNGCPGPSINAIVTVLPVPSKAITPTGNLKIFSTSSQTISASTGAGYSYQWMKDGIVLLGATASTYTANDEGLYTAMISANACSVESNSLRITKNKAPVADAGLDKSIVLPVNLSSLEGSGSDPDGFIAAYQWRVVAKPVTASAPIVSNLNNANISLTGLMKGNYVFGLRITDDFGEQSIEDLVTVSVVQPANNYNWIKETQVLVKNKLNDADVNALQVQNGEVGIVWNYFDGLGRPMQTVITQNSPSPNKLDIVTPIVYDQFGREAKKYLPFASGNDGWYKPNNEIIDASGNYIGVAANFYNTPSSKIAVDLSPYSETKFEPSPLNRVLKQGAPGANWQPTSDIYSTTDYTIKKRYEFNGPSEVYLFAYNSNTGLVSLPSGTAGYYQPDQLYANKTFDEHNNDITEYVDKEGRRVCKKVKASATEYAFTYYIYDDLGNLAVVLPPEAVKTFQN